MATLFYNHSSIPVPMSGAPTNSYNGHLAAGTLTRSALTGSLKGHSIAALKSLAANGRAAVRLEGQFSAVADASNTLLSATGVVMPASSAPSG